MSEFMIWPDDLERTGLSAEDIQRLRNSDLTFTLTLNNGESATVRTAEGEKFKLIPVDFHNIVRAALEVINKTAKAQAH